MGTLARALVPPGAPVAGAGRPLSQRGAADTVWGQIWPVRYPRIRELTVDGGGVAEGPCMFVPTPSSVRTDSSAVPLWSWAPSRGGPASWPFFSPPASSPALGAREPTSAHGGMRARRTARGALSSAGRGPLWHPEFESAGGRMWDPGRASPQGSRRPCPSVSSPLQWECGRASGWENFVSRTRGARGTHRRPPLPLF